MYSGYLDEVGMTKGIESSEFGKALQYVDTLIEQSISIIEKRKEQVIDFLMAKRCSAYLF